MKSEVQRPKSEGSPKSETRIGAWVSRCPASSVAFAIALAASVCSANGGDVLLFSFFRNNGQDGLCLASSDSAEGPFGPAGPPFTGDWVEGPSAIEVGGVFHVFFDHYAKPQYYGAAQSSDLVHWQDISDRVSFPKGARHGTVLRVPEIIVERIQRKTSQP
jgi:hypothetical protein